MKSIKCEPHVSKTQNRTHPLSWEKGGCTVIVEKKSGGVTEYPDVKFPEKFMAQIWRNDKTKCHIKDVYIKPSMQILTMDGYFHLPNDFDGSIADAFRLYADYIESPKSNEIREVSTAKYADLSYDDKWKEFDKGVKAGFRFTGTRQLYRLDDDKWIEIADKL